MNNRSRRTYRASLTEWLEERSAQKWVERMIRDEARYQSAFERWVLAKPGRRERYDDIVGALHASGAEAKVTRARNEPKTVSKRWWITEIVATPAFAAVALLLCGAAVYMATPMLGKTGHDQAAEYAAANRAYSNKVGEVRSIKLPDGSTVVLDTDSTMMVRYTREKREIMLFQGRARFDVAHDGTRPFVVLGDSSKVVALGTLFDVSVRNGFEVQLFRGSVEVTLPSRQLSSLPPAAVRLQPGQKISFTGSAGKASVESRRIRPSDEQWVSGVKIFDDVPAREVVEEANTYSTVKIEFVDPTLAEKLVVIQCNIRDISDVAAGLSKQFDLQVDRSQPGKILLK